MVYSFGSWYRDNLNTLLVSEQYNLNKNRTSNNTFIVVFRKQQKTPTKIKYIFMLFLAE